MTKRTLPVTERTNIGRHPERGRTERAALYEILDEALICHVGLATDAGPVVIPTTHARDGDRLVIHGSPAATWLRSGGLGTPVCVTVTLVDGLVLARSPFHHSMNYRSAVVFGTAERLTDLDEKRAALDALVEHVVPGRASEVRPHHEEELRTTLVLVLPLREASVKVRTGGPVDEPEDYALPHWAGVLPMSTRVGPPMPDEQLPDGIAVPASVAGYRRPSREARS